MTASLIHLVPLFVKELQLCKLQAGEAVGIYSEGGARRTYAEAFAYAARELGASAFHVDLPASRGKDLMAGLGGRVGERGLAEAPGAVAAFKECDLMVDLQLILFEPELHEIQATGTRVISCIEPPEVLARMLPTVEQRHRAEVSLEMIAEANTLRVTSPAGTDVTYQFGEFAPFCQYGYSDTPGRWDHFPSTFVVHCPNPDGTNGRFVLKPGDTIWPFARVINDPVILSVNDGYIMSIEGDADALLLRDHMERYNDPQAFAMSHIGWGLNESAHWDALLTSPNTVGMDYRSYEGCVMISTGPNTEFGGKNSTSCHFDIPMRDCSVYLDDVLIVQEGKLVDERLDLQ